MKRVAFIGFVLALTVVVLGAGSAFAHVTSFVIEDGSCAVDCESLDITSLSGNITCTAGEEFFVKAALRQFGETVAVGRASGTCTGSLQNWETSEIRNFLALDCAYPLLLTGQAATHGQRVGDTQYYGGC